MDEQRLAALFRDAVGEPPPASFGREEVVAASQRITVRRRNALAGGTLFSVAALVAGVIAGDYLLQGQTAAGQPSLEAAQAADPATPHVLSSPPGAERAGARSGAAGGDQVGCSPLDTALAGALTTVLADHGTAVVGPADEVSGWCPPGSRAAALPVTGGTLSIVVVPRTAAPEPATLTLPDGRQEHARILDDGRGLVMLSMPAVPGQRAPLSNELPAVATQLAAWL